MTKKCNNCSQGATYSLVVVLSTRGTSNRAQKCSRAVLFCHDCLQELCQREHSCSSDLNKAVNSVFTAISDASTEQSRAEGAQQQRSRKLV
jgi:hypothetical protein